VDEAKLISRQIAETKIEIGVCTRLKSKGIMMRLGKQVGDLLAAYELKLVDLENQLQALAKKPAAKPAASNRLPSATPAKPSAPAAKAGAPVAIAAKAAPASTVAAKVPAKIVAPAPVAAKAVAAKSAALEPKAAPARKAAPVAPAKRR
jgi:hypothetical protein